jgi:hypothetical protein
MFRAFGAQNSISRIDGPPCLRAFIQVKICVGTNTQDVNIIAHNGQLS